MITSLYFFLQHLANAVNANELLKLVAMFGLEQYVETRAAENFKKLLKHLAHIFLNQSNEDLLETCSDVFTALVANNLSIKSTAVSHLLIVLSNFLISLSHSLSLLEIVLLFEEVIFFSRHLSPILCVVGVHSHFAKDLQTTNMRQRVQTHKR